VGALSLDDLAAVFRAGSLPKAEWTHVAHLRVGAWHIHHFGPETALELLRMAIRRLNDHHGTANSPSGGYHETITAAYLRLIADFLSAFGADVALGERVDALIDGPLADRSVLLRFWSRPLLMSERARAGWAPPDLAPLAVPPEALARIRR
jgi:hypothetical protein